MKPDWASRKVCKAMDGLVSLQSLESQAATLLRNEHRRAVRVVEKAKDSCPHLDRTHEYDEGYYQACADILHKLKEGRP